MSCIYRLSFDFLRQLFVWFPLFLNSYTYRVVITILLKRLLDIDIYFPSIVQGFYLQYQRKQICKFFFSFISFSKHIFVFFTCNFRVFINLFTISYLVLLFIVPFWLPSHYSFRLPFLTRHNVVLSLSIHQVFLILQRNSYIIFIDVRRI